MKHNKSLNFNTLENEAFALAKTIKGGEVFGLTGKLGSGKTTFVKILGKHLKIKRKITSPSFRLMHNYEAKTKDRKKIIVYHLDLYRIKDWKEAEALGLKEIFESKTSVVVIEWANKIKSKLPKNTVWLKFKGL